jgi:hypothetical protein
MEPALQSDRGFQNTKQKPHSTWERELRFAVFLSSFLACGNSWNRKRGDSDGWEGYSVAIAATTQLPLPLRKAQGRLGGGALDLVVAFIAFL